MIAIGKTPLIKLESASGGSELGCLCLINLLLLYRENLNITNTRHNRSRR